MVVKGLRLIGRFCLASGFLLIAWNTSLLGNISFPNEHRITQVCSSSLKTLKQLIGEVRVNSNGANLNELSAQIAQLPSGSEKKLALVDITHQLLADPTESRVFASFIEVAFGSSDIMSRLIRTGKEGLVAALVANYFDLRKRGVSLFEYQFTTNLATLQSFSLQSAALKTSEAKAWYAYFALLNWFRIRSRQGADPVVPPHEQKERIALDSNVFDYRKRDYFSRLISGLVGKYDSAVEFVLLPGVVAETGEEFRGRRLYNINFVAPFPSEELRTQGFDRKTLKFKKRLVKQIAESRHRVQPDTPEHPIMDDHIAMQAAVDGAILVTADAYLFRVFLDAAEYEYSQEPFVFPDGTRFELFKFKILDPNNHDAFVWLRIVDLNNFTNKGSQTRHWYQAFY